MSKSEEFRIKTLLKEHHDFRKRKALQQREMNDQEFRDELRRFGRGEYDQEQGPPVHEE